MVMNILPKNIELGGKMEAYIVKHWRGEFPLWKSYWLNTVIGSLVGALILGTMIGIVVGIVCAAAGIKPSSDTLNMAGKIIAIPVVFWAYVGTWRSADNYNKERNEYVFTWGNIAKFFMCLGAFQLFASFFAVC